MLAVLLTSVLSAAVLVALNNACVVPIIAQQNAKISEVQSTLEHEVELGDEDLREMLRDALQKLDITREEFGNATARFSEELGDAKARIFELEDKVKQLNRDLSTFEATTASKNAVDHLSVTVAMLNTTKVNISDFEVLSSDVSNLRALVITKADRDVVVDLEENLNILAANALNHSHYDQLQDSIDMLEVSKASQEDFEILLSNFTSLANNTVRRSDFLQLSAAVDAINNSTVKKEQFFDLALNVSTLKYYLGLINITLTSKADQRDVDQLTERLTTLSDTTVTNEVFETLAGTVQTLKTSKADRSSLSELETTVNHIRDTAAKQSELRTLSGTVSDHMTSSHKKHDQLTSTISANNRKIRDNTAHIQQVQTQVNSMSDSTPGQTASWTTVIATTSLVVMYMYASTYT